MSKRRSRRSAPNIPQETLERARRQAAGEEVDLPATPSPAESAPARPPRSRAERREEMGIPASRRRDVSRASGRRRAPRTADEMNVEEIDYILNHPTKEVSAEQLASEYRIVVNDIRNMMLLAAVLFGVIFVVGLTLG